MSAKTSPAYVAILDDFQQVAASCADWQSLLPEAQPVFFHDHIEDVAQLAARLQPYSAVVLTRERTRFHADLIRKLPNLKLINSIGMTNASIDIAAANAQNITVSGTLGGNRHAMPHLIWALILGISRGVYAEAASFRAGGWQIGMGTEIHGKTLGLIGLGKIGVEVAKIGPAFGMKMLAWSQNLTPEEAAKHGCEYVSKDELFRRSDVISIQVRLSARTQDLVSAHELSLMKPSAYLVNTARGPVVNEAALLEALQQKRIAGAALDVYDVEPLTQNHPFRYLPNVLATPHIGYVNDLTYYEAYPQMIENIKAWLAGAPIRIMKAG